MAVPLTFRFTMYRWQMKYDGVYSAMKGALHGKEKLSRCDLVERTLISPTAAYLAATMITFTKAIHQ